VASTPSTPSEASELSELSTPSTPSTPSGPEELVLVENETQLEATTIESIANIENQLVASDGLTAVSEENIVSVLESFN
jgi:hypothetical protein